MPISHEHKAIFIHIPKTAGTSIETVLGVRGDNKQVDYSIFFGHDLQHLTAAELARHERMPQGVFESYFKFAVVRNPWDRVVSEYMYCPDDYGEDHRAGLRMFLEDRFSRPEGPGVHLRPQIDYVTDEQGRTMVDKIVRFENLEEDLEEVWRVLGMEGVELPVRKTTEHYHYSTYHSRRSRHLVSELYAEEIERFGYEFENRPERLRRARDWLGPRVKVVGDTARGVLRQIGPLRALVRWWSGKRKARTADEIEEVDQAE
jgi:hypothetical protein